ncbi:MAG: hypothetical protein JSW60_09280 [Thermoplasmatales archaeon]|nr:MAG: hypothetical protein JSW60_09280 [Thermoplasmatales archaeon]
MVIVILLYVTAAPSRAAPAAVPFLTVTVKSSSSFACEGASRYRAHDVTRTLVSEVLFSIFIIMLPVTGDVNENIASLFASVVVFLSPVRPGITMLTKTSASPVPRPLTVSSKVAGLVYAKGAGDAVTSAIFTGATPFALAQALPEGLFGLK